MKYRTLIGIALWAFVLSACSRSDRKIVISWALPVQFIETAAELIQVYNEQNPAVSVSLKPLSQDIKSQIKEINELRRLNTADIITADAFLLNYLLNEHFLRPLKKQTLKEPLNDYTKGAINLCRIDEQTVSALPWMVDTHALYFRQDLLSASDFPPPATWEDVQRTVEYMQLNAKEPIAGLLFGGKSENMLSLFFIEMLWSRGLDIITEDGDIMLDLPQITNLLKDWQRWLKTNMLSKKIPLLTRAEALSAFVNGESVFYYGLLSDWKEIQQVSSKNPGSVSFSFSAAPGYDDYRAVTHLDGFVLALSNKSVCSNECLNLMSYLTSFSAQEILLINDYIPALENVFIKSEAVQYKSRLENMPAILDAAEPLSLHRITPAILNTLDTGIASVFLLKKGPAEILYETTARLKSAPEPLTAAEKNKKIDVKSAPPPAPLVKPTEKIPVQKTAVTGLQPKREAVPPVDLLEYKQPAPITGLNQPPVKTFITGLQEKPLLSPTTIQPASENQ